MFKSDDDLKIFRSQTRNANENCDVHVFTAKKNGKNKEINEINVMRYENQKFKAIVD